MTETIEIISYVLLSISVFIPLGYFYIKRKYTHSDIFWIVPLLLGYYYVWKYSLLLFFIFFFVSTAALIVLDFSLKSDLNKNFISKKKLNFKFSTIKKVLILTVSIHIIIEVLNKGFEQVLKWFNVEIKEQDVVTQISQEEDMLMLIILFASVVLLAPILEEYCFRFFIYDYFLKRKLLVNPMTAILITTLIFAVVHQSPTSIFSLIVAGFFLNVIYQKWGLWYSMIGHGTMNFLSFLYIKLL